MNGRVYDPELGRFLSPDAVIQDVSNLQTINAYLLLFCAADSRPR